jgi:hypothetical protein
MKFNLKERFEIVGILAVIVSLLFVGIQLQLDRRLSLATVYQDRAESRKEDLRARMEYEAERRLIETQIESGRYPGWWTSEVAALHEQQNIPISELVRNQQTTYIDLLQLDNLIFQSELGFLEPELLDSVLGQWERSINSGSPILEEVMRAGLVRPAMIATLEELRN